MILLVHLYGYCMLCYVLARADLEAERAADVAAVRPGRELLMLALFDSLFAS